MRISVVTTCWNRAASVGNSIKSVMSQTYQDVEHIVVDGASTDGTLQAIQACGSKRISQLISEPDKGAYQAMNKGIRLATGDIIGLLHSDDVFFDEGVLADIARKFEETDCDLLYCDGVFVSESNPDWIIRDWIGGTYSDESMRNGWLPLHTTVFVKRSVYERFGYYREDYKISSDTDWLLRCMYQTGIKIAYLNRHVVVMGYGGLSTSWDKTLLRWREDLGIYKRHGISPRTALLQKVLRKFPQFFKAPFATVSKLDRQTLIREEQKKRQSE